MFDTCLTSLVLNRTQSVLMVSSYIPNSYLLDSFEPQGDFE